MIPRRVTVVGSGVIGLSVAHDLAARGHRVRVVADHDAAGTVSSVAAAIWFPYRGGSSNESAAWLAASLRRFVGYAEDPATGVDLRRGTVIERRPGTDRSWTDSLEDCTEAASADLPAGALAGVHATVPVITMSQYLPWLVDRCVRLGVSFESRTVAALSELDDGPIDVVVLAAGLRAAELIPDEALTPVRGQVVLLPNPGLTAWLIDDDHPDGLTYVVPRRDGVVCGGTSEDGVSDLRASPGTEAAILRRATALVPELAGLPVVSRAVGLRPVRTSVRLQWVAGAAVPTIACYGHGGAGVTLSWGCAEHVVRLVDSGT